MYRYRTINPNTINELKYGEVFFAPRENLNDPLDMKVPIRWSWEQKDEQEDLFKFVLGNEIRFRERDAKIISPNGERKVRSIIQPYQLHDYVQLFCDEMKRSGQKKVLNIEETEKWLTRIFTNEKAELPLYHLKEIFGLLYEMIERDFKKVGVLCFSKELDMFKMWSLYADNHRGICIKYDESKMELIEKENFHISSPLHVNYDEDVWSVSFGSYMALNASLSRNEMVDTNQTLHFFYKLMTFKRKFWKDEAEIRILRMKFEDSNIPEENMVKLNVDSIQEIYLGALISKENEARIKFIAKHYLKDIKLFKMQFNDEAMMKPQPIQF
jgi:hypothetical protein